MATPAQITANRLNAQKSTGPRSDEGKAVARFNALKHAASAQSLIIPGEEEAALAELSRSYHDQFRPVGPEEHLLVEKIIAADWTQRRMHRLETEVTNALIDQQDPEDQNPLGTAYIKDCEGPNALHKIFRRYEAASRDWFRAIAHLRQLQADRIVVLSRPSKPQAASANSQTRKSPDAPAPGPRPLAPTSAAGPRPLAPDPRLASFSTNLLRRAGGYNAAPAGCENS